MDQKEAITGADYVITTFQQGGLDAYKLDIEIPEKYGVGQCVGDTLGPGGVFRGLRTTPVLLEICQTMDEVAPHALLINYVNPMSALCWFVDKVTGWPHVGYCHSVQHTSSMLAKWIDTPIDEVTYLCAGINHQAFFLDFRRGEENLYPLIWEAAEREEIDAREPVRIELMKHFGYFVTESSGHASEYAPYFRKSAKMIEEELVPRFKPDFNDWDTYEGSHWFDFARTGGYLRFCDGRLSDLDSSYEKVLSGEEPLPDKRSEEFGSFTMEAIETNQPVRVNGNVPNNGLIDNLPTGCCVEVPCLVDGNGVQPTKLEYYPPQLAALNRTMINVQELLVEAAVTGDVDAVYHAVMLDPLTAAVCTLPQIHDMVTDMLRAQAQWLPQFEL
jgi:alpha-galactosidase